MALKFIISLILSLFVAFFAIQNSGSVNINVLFATYTISQALVIIISAIAGAIVVLFLGTIQQVKQSMKSKDLSKTISKLEEENRVLKEKTNIVETKPGEGIQESPLEEVASEVQ